MRRARRKHKLRKQEGREKKYWKEILRRQERKAEMRVTGTVQHIGEREFF